jgi:hypothetical protein
MVANPRRIGQLNLTFHYPDSFLPTEEQKTLLEDIAMTCPVAESIHPDIKLEVNFNWPTLV